MNRYIFALSYAPQRDYFWPTAAVSILVEKIFGTSHALPGIRATKKHFMKIDYKPIA